MYNWQPFQALQLDKIRLVQTNVPSRLSFFSYQSKPFFKHKLQRVPEHAGKSWYSCLTQAIKHIFFLTSHLEATEPFGFN